MRSSVGFVILCPAVFAVAACAPTLQHRSPVTGKTYCGGIMDYDLGDRLAQAKSENQRFYAVIDFRADRPASSGNVMADIASCSGTLCFASATKRQLFEYCDWVGVREISAWDP